MLKIVGGKFASLLAAAMPSGVN